MISKAGHGQKRRDATFSALNYMSVRSHIRSKPVGAVEIRIGSFFFRASS